MQRAFFARLLFALSVASSWSAARAQPAEPLRLGFLSVRTGPLAAGGRQMEEGINVLLKQRGGMLAGRKVELIVADTGGQPAQAKTRTQELIERDQVHVIIGTLDNFDASHIRDYVNA